MTHISNLDLESITFPPLIHISRKFLFGNHRHEIHPNAIKKPSLGWRHKARQQVRLKFTIKELLEIASCENYFAYYRQAILLDQTLFEIHNYWKRKYNREKFSFAMIGWKYNLPGDVVQCVLEYLPLVGKNPSGPWKLCYEC